MKILIVHSYYQQKGGEDAVFRNEQALLNGSEDVRILEFENPTGIKGAGQFLLSLWNVSAARKLKKLILDYRPDIIHLHNIHFAIGPAAIRVAKKANVPIVQTLHNYRLLCPSATLSYKGDLFTDSIHSGFPWKAIRKKVYRGSFFATFWLACVTAIHKKIGTWQMIDKYIVFTEFAKDLFSESALHMPSEKFVVKPNFIDHSGVIHVKTERYFLFVGRLSDEKGIRVLLKAFSLSDFELQIAGDGPLKELVEQACRKHANIKFLGAINRQQVEKAMQYATALVFPSIWYEGMPMTILEALAAGTPVIASNLGAMGSMIRDGYNGVHFNAGDAAQLVEKLRAWQELSDDERSIYRKNAYASYVTNYSPEINRSQLLNIYKSCIYAKSTY